MNFKKLHLTCLIALLLVWGVCSIAYAAPLDNAQLLGILPDKAGNELTRAEFGAMLVKAADLQPGEKSAALPADVQAGTWYADCLQTLLSKDIIKGFADGTVHPDNPISQSEAVVMVARTLGIPSIAYTRDVEDISLSSNHWAYDTYNWMAGEGLITQLNPKQKLSRQDGANLLVNIFGTADKCNEINDQIEAANKEIKSFRLAGTMDMKMDIRPVDGVDPATAMQKTTMNMQSELVMDKGLHMIMDTEVPVANQKQKKLTIEQYMTREGMFFNMPDPATGNATWKKMPAVIPNFMDLLDSQSNPLPANIRNMFHFRYLGEEKLGDQEVIKLAFYGEIKDINKILSSLGGLNGQLQEAVSQAGGILKSVSYLGKMYVDKETLLPIKVNNFSVVTYNAEFQGKPFPIKSIQANYDFNYSDYNVQIDLVVPQEALNAEELNINLNDTQNSGN